MQWPQTSSEYHQHILISLSCDNSYCLLNRLSNLQNSQGIFWRSCEETRESTKQQLLYALRSLAPNLLPCDWRTDILRLARAANPLRLTLIDCAIVYPL